MRLIFDVRFQIIVVFLRVVEIAFCLIQRNDRRVRQFCGILVVVLFGALQCLRGGRIAALGADKRGIRPRVHTGKAALIGQLGIGKIQRRRALRRAHRQLALADLPLERLGVVDAEHVARLHLVAKRNVHCADLVGQRGMHLRRSVLAALDQPRRTDGVIDIAARRGVHIVFIHRSASARRALRHAGVNHAADQQQDDQCRDELLPDLLFLLILLFCAGCGALLLTVQPCILRYFNFEQSHYTPHM